MVVVFWTHFLICFSTKKKDQKFISSKSKSDSTSSLPIHINDSSNQKNFNGYQVKLSDPKYSHTGDKISFRT